MKTAAVVIDDWKLPVFKKRLDAAGYKYTEHPGVTSDTLTLRVSYEWVAELKPVIEAANAECANTKTVPCSACNGAPGLPCSRCMGAGRIRKEPKQ